MIRKIILFLTLCCAITAHAADDIVGKVIGVTDGDTVTVLDESRTQHKIRLAEIDTPERHQAFGTRAKQALSKKIFGKIVRVRVETTDRYGRTVGTIFLEDRHINKEMVAEGFAWHYKKYSKDETLAQLEKAARMAKLGLWAHENPVPPWTFRKPKGTGSPSRAKSGTVAKPLVLEEFRRPKKTASPAKVETSRPLASSTQLSGFRPQPSEDAAAASFWLNTSSGVRHNKACVHFKNTKRGRPCAKTDGKACGICGG